MSLTEKFPQAKKLSFRIQSLLGDLEKAHGMVGAGAGTSSFAALEKECSDGINALTVLVHEMEILAVREVGSHKDHWKS